MKKTMEKRIMKKRNCLTGLLLAGVMCLGMSGSAWAADMAITIDGSRIASDVAPEVKNGTTFVPLRVVSESLGADVRYIPANATEPAYACISNYLVEDRIRNIKTTTADITLTEDCMYFYAGEPMAYVAYDMMAGGEVSREEQRKLTREGYSLGAAAYVKNNRIMVPLRFIAEQIGFTVDYANMQISITSGKKLMLDGVEIKDMLLEDDYVTKNKSLISNTIKLLEAVRGTQCEKPADYVYVTHELVFRNAADEVVAVWQFASSAGKSEVYLHDRLNDVWYSADSDVFAEKYSDNLENYFLPPFYSFEKLPYAKDLSYKKLP